MRLTALDQLGAGLVDEAVQLVGEMLGPQDISVLVIDAVIGQQDGEQGLLDLAVGRQRPGRQVTNALITSVSYPIFPDFS